MAAGKEEREVEIKSGADKFFHIFRRGTHHIPTICRERVHGIEVHDGDWETPGSVKQWSFSLGDNKTETAKEKVESVDEENKSIVFDFHEGDVMKLYKKYKVTLHVIPKGTTATEGSLVKWTVDYEKVNDDVPPPTKYVDLAVAVTLDIDSHLIKA